MNQSMVRDVIGGAAVGASISGSLAWLFGAVLRGVEPIVFLAFGIYAGMVYVSIVAAVLGPRERESAVPAQRPPIFGLALAPVYSHSR